MQQGGVHTCNVVIFTGNILKVFPIRIDKKVLKICNAAAARGQFFQIVHALVYVLDEWILFTVFC